MQFDKSDFSGETSEDDAMSLQDNYKTLPINRKKFVKHEFKRKGSKF